MGQHFENVTTFLKCVNILNILKRVQNFEKRLKCWNRSTPGLFCLKLFSKFTMLVVISCSPQKSFLSRNLITFLSSEQQAPLLLGCFASSFGLIRLAENLWPQNILWHYDTIVMTASRNSIEATMWGGVGVGWGEWYHFMDGFRNLRVFETSLDDFLCYF